MTRASKVRSPLVQTTVAGEVQRRPSYDGNGNITAWTRSTQTVPEHRREYDAFGNVLVSEGASPSEFGFSTKMKDPFTGLSYYGYRYYDPVTGRWPSRDPIEEEGGVNLYGFVENDCLNLYDYLGLVAPAGAAAAAWQWFSGGATLLGVADMLGLGVTRKLVQPDAEYMAGFNSSHFKNMIGGLSLSDSSLSAFLHDSSALAWYRPSTPNDFQRQIRPTSVPWSLRHLAEVPAVDERDWTSVKITFKFDVIEYDFGVSDHLFTGVIENVYDRHNLPNREIDLNVGIKYSVGKDETLKVWDQDGRIHSAG